MIEAKHNAAVVAFFNFYVRWKVKHRFSDVEVTPLRIDPSRAVLVIGNHFSWWDGFFLLWVNMQQWKRKFFILMLEEQLATRKLFARAGAFSIRKGSRDVVHSLRYAGEVLKDPRSMLVLFPQGRIQSPHEALIHFEPGVEKIVELTPDAQVVFSASFADYGTAQPKPRLRIFMQTCMVTPFTASAAEEAYHHFYKDCLATLSAETEARHGR